MSAYFDALHRRSNVAVFAPAPHAPVRIPTAARRLVPGEMPAEYARLREKLMVAANHRPLRTLLFAGCDGGEGCTRVTREFAEMLASSGLNTLLVDADLQTSGLTSSIAADGPDLKELVGAGQAPAGVPWGRGQLAVVSSPPSHPDKEQFFRAPAFATWLEDQRQRHDYVLLDAPPLLRYAEGVLVSRLSDGVVIVVKAEATRRESLVRAREQLERAEANIVGVVLNHARDYVPVFLRPYLSTE
jgi:Mrp family chromosome partitioning ATPase